MLLVRVIAGLLAITVGSAIVMFLVTRNRRWLRFAWRTLRLGILVLLISFGFYALERFLLVL
ncbi:MAG TPA: hypothetical protein VMP00_02380 [Burkholderiales bacterium]|nr:hypothetical protein [Burkholderiales bacterium]